MKANIKQISENTGFSPATVSNALNGKPGVNQHTAQLIRDEAERLGYSSFNKISRIKFVTYRKTGEILDGSAFFPAVIEGVEKQARELGYETVFIRLDCQDTQLESQIKEILHDTSAAVILLATEMDEEDIARFEGMKGDLLLLDGWSDFMNWNAVLINSTDSVCRAMEYLISCGHQKIGYIRGAYRIKAFQYREYGYRRVLEKYQLPYCEAYVATVGTTPESAYEGMKQYLDAHPELPSAFFADNDCIAIGAMKALKEQGYRIPEDISLIGFDDLPLSCVVHPELTTIHVFKRNMGEIAVRSLMEVVHHRDEGVRKIEVCGELVIRQSVKTICSAV